MFPNGRLLDLYKSLLSQLGHRRKWWPADAGPLREWEICAGAILTQNTNWRNVEKALANLKRAKSMSPKKIASMPLPKLRRLLKPSGFYRQKAKRLRELASFALTFGSLENFFSRVTRDQLLEINGIGPETADSILLYACGKPHFVIDAYTRRLLERLKIISGKESYDELQRMFHAALPRKVGLYKDFHALIVEHAKSTCRKNPDCATCALRHTFGGCDKLYRSNSPS